MRITLWEDQIPFVRDELDTPNSMTAYPVLTYYPVPAVIVLPGGAYAGREPHEGEAIARYFQSKGFQAFVVDYRLHPNDFFAILADAQRAVKIVRRNAKQYRVNPDQIFLAGFSAGGHLAASTALLEDQSMIGDDYDAVSPRPNGLILGYPLILSRRPDGELANTFCRIDREDLSLDRWVTADTPPCFLWHTVEDATVDVGNSLQFAMALKEHGVAFEMHIFPKGKHGLGLAQLYAGVRTWPEMSVDWILRQ